MYDPKKVLTPDGYHQLVFHLTGIKLAISFILNHADDLHIGALDDKQLDVLYQMQSLIDSRILETGDGEEETD